MGVFKAYDVRGIWAEEIDERFTYRIGRALGKRSPQTYMVGHDARIHSRTMYAAVIRGLIEEGRDVIGVGLASTPMLHFLQVKAGCQAGVMVTASHNPKQYHGMKVFDGVGGSISYEKGLDQIEAAIGARLSKPVGQKGTFREEDRLEEYVEFVAARAEGMRFDLRLVVDISNGSAGREFERLAQRLGLDVLLVNAEPDGTFPAHDPNPLKDESRLQATEKIRAERADLGAILDGDGDRILFVDEQGQRIENYFVSALIAELLLELQPGATFVYDLISSRALPERIGELGGRAIVSRVGYTYLYDAMVRESAVFGSETSGHVYFKVSDAYYTESSAYALVTLMRLLAAREQKLSELVAPLKNRYVQSEEINLEVDDKISALKRVETAFQGATISRLDGVSVELPDCWLNARPSNTEPVLRIRLEGLSSEAVAERRAQLLAVIGS